MYNSPIPGRKDDTPSFVVYEKNGQLRWTDHGLTNQCGYHPVNLVIHMRGLPCDTEEEIRRSYGIAKRIIDTEIKIGMMGKPPTQLRSRPQYDRPPLLRTGAFRDWEHEYWNRFELSEEELRYESTEALHSLTWE